jgi:magnesium-protoporphyrin O-methyltransferase
MDSLIHYDVADGVRVLTQLADSVQHSMLFTFAPRTPFLGTFHSMGRIFPRSNRSPSLEPVPERKLWQLLENEPFIEPAISKSLRRPATLASIRIEPG